MKMRTFKKSTVICLALSFISLMSFGQIEILKTNKTKSVEVGKVYIGLDFVSSLKYSPQEGDTTYVLTFWNREFQRPIDMQVIYFNGNQKTLDDLYTVCKSVFEEENRKNKDYNVFIQLGADKVLISTWKYYGLTHVNIRSKEGYFILTESQLEKLFNKRKAD